MLSRKEQISAVKELMNMNKVIVDINMKMAELHIKKKKIKKSKKNTLNVKRSNNSFFDIFMEEAHKTILQDAIDYWIEEHNINSEEVLTTTKVEKTSKNNLLDSNSNNKTNIKQNNTVRDNTKISTSNKDVKIENKSDNKNKELNIKSNTTTNKQNELKVESKIIQDKEIDTNKSNEIVKKENKNINNLFNKTKISAKDLFKDVKKEESFQLSFSIF